MSKTSVTQLPESLQVEYRLNLTDCTALESLPDGLKVGSLVLSGCTALQELPAGLDLNFLDITGCSQLTVWPESGRLKFGRLRASGCTGLTELPAWLQNLSQLDVRNCTSLKTLPAGLQVSSWIDLANTKITELPDSMQNAIIHWGGVPINQQIAFHPETIPAQSILEEPNSELRRVMLARVGFQKFFQEVDAEILDTDQDPGGQRQLLRVPLEDDEALVCVSVNCPSTARQYLIRVPPLMKTCHQAIAWTAGFNNPDDYRPFIET